MTAMRETQIYKEAAQVDNRLSSIKLKKEPLLTIRTMALGAGADATPFHASNAEGTFTYHIGLFALRKEHVGAIWKVDRSNGIDSIRNDQDRVKVVFSNVDIACSDGKKPKPRSAKGAGAERLCSENDMFGGLPHFAPAQPSSDKGWTVYYLMVAPNGAAELSRPIVKDKIFKAFVERIYLSDGSDFGVEPKSLLDDDIADSFDPQIIRKK
ncbi:MAG: hypothetical protein COA52_08305 [Hyphomicrobiales bacterium]|nr:hypothetical protein [Hyphomicrobiales bacterium]PCJ91837.1 MAG: hypothetical protein COA52_08305 [Hyphomicrobiales bacterium]